MSAATLIASHPVPLPSARATPSMDSSLLLGVRWQPEVGTFSEVRGLNVVEAENLLDRLEANGCERCELFFLGQATGTWPQ